MAGIYLHIPFCKQACVYCNFHFSTSVRQKEAVLEAMMQEIQLQKNYLQGQTIDTIYFGGGTPSLLTADEINRLTDLIQKNFLVGTLKEVTLEANPDDLTSKYIASLRNTVVNRLSIGIQSFRDEDLVFMHRAHTTAQSDYAIKAAQDAGFTNLTIDLIYGVPGLTDQHWSANLRKITEYQLSHFSSYALTVEPKTALHHMVAQHKTPGTDAGQAAGQFELLMEQAATMGFDHYEISNFGLPGFHAVHNTNYWMGVPYLGLGPGAHSFNGLSRSWNIANNALYAKEILTHQKLNAEVEHLSAVDQLNEYIMTSLRTMWGMNRTKLEKVWGAEALKTIESQIEKFLRLQQIVLDGDDYKLTQKGKLFADHIASSLFFDQAAFQR